MYIYMYVCVYIYIWGFPKMGVPPNPFRTMAVSRSQKAADFGSFGSSQGPVRAQTAGSSKYCTGHAHSIDAGLDPAVFVRN